MGVVLEHALPTYPAGFPDPLVARLAETTGQTFICNRPANGVAAIDEFGEEHLRTGALILYTSQDSVLQLAGHVDRVAPEELYTACELARGALSGNDAVGRVIARPFEGSPGSFSRTEGRRDWALSPPRSYLDAIQESGIPVHGVGKIADLFAGRGIDESHPGATNEAALTSVAVLERELDSGPRLREPDRDRPGVRAPQGRRGFRAGARRDRQRGRRARGAPRRRRPARDHRRPRRRPVAPGVRPHPRARPAARSDRRHDRRWPAWRASRRRPRRRRRERTRTLRPRGGRRRLPGESFLV